jgi:hypothetical protein
VVGEGEKARLGAKREIWAHFDEAGLLTSLVKDAASGALSEADLDARLTPAEAA